MKTLLILTACVGLAGAAAWAEPIVYEGFDHEEYSIGASVAGAGPVVPGFEGDWIGSAEAVIEENSMGYLDLKTAGHKLVMPAAGSNRTLYRMLDTEEGVAIGPGSPPLYMAFTMRRWADPENPGGGTGGEDAGIAAFGVGAWVPERQQAMRLFEVTHWRGAGDGGADQPWKLARIGNLTDANTWAFAPGNSAVNLFVLKFDWDTDGGTIAFWMNPQALGGAAPAPTLTLSVNDTTLTAGDLLFDGIHLTSTRGTSGINRNDSHTVWVDEIRFGATFASVTPVETAEPPSAQNVAIDGQPRLGETLTGVYTYVGGVSEGSSAFRWLRADTAGGPYAPIGGATGSTYTLTQNDLGKFVVFEVTPVDIDGLQGSAAQSGPLGPVYTLGDFNGDGVLSGLDIPGFKQALADPDGWAAANPGRPHPNTLGDFNGDGVFSGLDIPGFKQALAGN